jgi:hypothetical protein
MPDGWSASVSTDCSKTNVTCVTLDHFLLENKLNHVDILKVDVQGSELQVLQGSLDSIRRGSFTFIQFEVLVWPTYQTQALPSETMNLLESNGYILYSIFDRVTKSLGGPLLQFDVLYVHSSFLR